MCLLREEHYFLPEGGSGGCDFAELVPVMDLTVLPIAVPILGISFSMFCAALRKPRARSSGVMPL